MRGIRASKAQESECIRPRSCLVSSSDLSGRKPMKLYDYAPSQNAYKVRMLLQHLDITWETVPIAIFRAESHSVNFLDRNPAGAVPVLEPEPVTSSPNPTPF